MLRRTKYSSLVTRQVNGTQMELIRAAHTIWRFSLTYFLLYFVAHFPHLFLIAWLLLFSLFFCFYLQPNRPVLPAHLSSILLCNTVSLCCHFSCVFISVCFSAFFLVDSFLIFISVVLNSGLSAFVELKRYISGLALWERHKACVLSQRVYIWVNINVHLVAQMCLGKIIKLFVTFSDLLYL